MQREAGQATAPPKVPGGSLPLQRWSQARLISTVIRDFIPAFCYEKFQTYGQLNGSGREAGLPTCWFPPLTSAIFALLPIIRLSRSLSIHQCILFFGCVSKRTLLLRGAFLPRRLLGPTPRNSDCEVLGTRPGRSILFQIHFLRKRSSTFHSLGHCLPIYVPLPSPASLPLPLSGLSPACVPQCLSLVPRVGFSLLSMLRVIREIGRRQSVRVSLRAGRSKAVCLEAAGCYQKLSSATTQWCGPGNLSESDSSAEKQRW